MSPEIGAAEDDGYDHSEVESRWQRVWDEQDVFHIEDDATDPAYVLSMFPYPSGEMHMGHVRNYTITDAYARYRRMQGDPVLHPMGWDSFGLPAENAAEERDTDPREWTMDCIESIKDQMKVMGLGFDWEREVTTCEPEYFRWNQWFFTRFFEEGLVERSSTELNWCPSCETVLADEQVEGEAELCWRCDTPIESRELDQWFLKTTDYADELTDELDRLDGWPENVKQMQRNWIGRQEGDVVEFDVPGYGGVEIFTTRLDTIHGATFLALSTAHPVAREMAETDDDVREYVDRVEDADEGEVDETSGVFTGEYAVNPATGEEIPVYVVDYVLDEVGTGALYAVPAHDERDHAFATEHDLPIRQSVAPEDGTEVDVQETPYTEDGVLVNSGEFDGLDSAVARDRFVEEFDGERRTDYRLQDWCISRQRYWGTPIPLIRCPDCGYVPVPDEDLPVELPEFINTAGNPLDAAEEWKAVECPDCGGDAERETDTMDTFVDSSWYFLRYVSPDRDDVPFDVEQSNDLMPVDHYIGGIEHATMHLIYSRFFTKVLADMDMLDVREPFENLLTQGMVRLDGTAMSSSKGNLVSPHAIVEEYGADTARLFMMSAAQPEKDFEWKEENVRTNYRFLQSFYEFVEAHAATERGTESDSTAAAAYVEREIDATAATATEEYEQFRFNHALQSIRELVSLLRRYREHASPDPETLERGLATATKLLAPVTPHVAEEIWDRLGRDGLVAEADWPTGDSPERYDVERRLVETTLEDVRDIVDVAGIADPETIEVAVAPEWKYRAVEVARTADDDVVGTVMADETLREQGEAAADFAKDLAAESQSLDRQLSPERERAALERAAWLMEAEFGANVVVETAEEASDELRAAAEPGRPALDIA